MHERGQKPGLQLGEVSLRSWRDSWKIRLRRYLERPMKKCLLHLLDKARALEDEISRDTFWEDYSGGVKDDLGEERLESPGFHACPLFSSRNHDSQSCW